jgi:hypothetical protein
MSNKRKEYTIPVSCGVFARVHNLKLRLSRSPMFRAKASVKGEFTFDDLIRILMEEANL